MNKLLTHKGYLSEHVYSLLKRIRFTADAPEIRNVVLTSDNLEVVALLENSCFIVKSDLKDTKLEKVGWTTAFFASLAYEMVTEPPINDEFRKVAVKRAIDNAHKHSGVELPDVLRSPSVAASGKKGSPSDALGEKWGPIKWKEIHDQWDSARNDIGIIEIDDGGSKCDCLELWRAKTDLPGYIAWSGKKRESIGSIWRIVSRFKVKPEKSVSILLEADPGFGKSYLAEKLSDQLNLPLIKHDISQMVQREELLDLFDMIAAKQAEQDLPVFVFVDEINATLGGSPVYGAFLAPLEAGNYRRRGRLFELKPCVWMFAGTPEDSGKIDKEKLKDFKSRLTAIEKIDYQSLLKKCVGFDVEDPGTLSKDQIEELIHLNDEAKQLDHEARLEQVYMGAQWINDAFNDVQKIDRDILSFFYSLNPSSSPARKIKRLASSLENIQYGKGHKGNCTSDLWRKCVSDAHGGLERYESWKKREEEGPKWVYIQLD